MFFPLVHPFPAQASSHMATPVPPAAQCAHMYRYGRYLPESGLVSRSFLLHLINSKPSPATSTCRMRMRAGCSLTDLFGLCSMYS